MKAVCSVQIEHALVQDASASTCTPCVDAKPVMLLAPRVAGKHGKRRAVMDDVSEDEERTSRTGGAKKQEGAARGESSNDAGPLVHSSTGTVRANRVGTLLVCPAHVSLMATICSI